MTSTLSAEISRQRTAARALLREASADGDDFLAAVVSARIAELDDIARRHNITESSRARSA